MGCRLSFQPGIIEPSAQVGALCCLGMIHTTLSGRTRYHLCLLLLMGSTPGSLLANPAEVKAAADASDAEAAPAATDSKNMPMAIADAALTTTRSTMRSSVEWLARGVDGWFGDIPFAQGGQVTDGELGWNHYKRQDLPASSGLRFKARFRLPNLAAVPYAFVGNDDRQDIVTDRPDTFSRQQQLQRGDKRDSAFFAGFGAALLNTVDLRLGFRGGLKPYAQARYRHRWQWGPADRVEFRETVFYSVADRLGSTTALSFEHAVTPTLALRWLHTLTATKASKDTAWSNSAGIYQSFGDERLLSFEALFDGVIGNPVTIPNYGLQARWSQPLYKDHLIGDIAIGHFWPRADVSSPRTQAWAMGTGIRLKF